MVGRVITALPDRSIDCGRFTDLAQATLFMLFPVKCRREAKPETPLKIIKYNKSNPKTLISYILCHKDII
jgi:hypothetical protein